MSRTKLLLIYFEEDMYDKKQKKQVIELFKSMNAILHSDSY